MPELFIIWSTVFHDIPAFVVEYTTPLLPTAIAVVKLLIYTSFKVTSINKTSVQFCPLSLETLIIFSPTAIIVFPICDIPL